ncbi:MAG: nucleotidyltransferase family protein [Hyphomicrobiales bacterium]
MTNQMTTMLAKLADPEAPVLELSAQDREKVLELARLHRVDNILWRKFGSNVDTKEGAHTLTRVGQSMLLDSLRHDIMDGFKEKGVSACIVKGPVFAQRLYTSTGDRLFTDIDLLIDPADMPKALLTMSELGYNRPTKTWDNSDRDMEYKFYHPDHPIVLIELHGNLVHYPLLRRRASFGLRDLLQAGEGDGEAPNALLATAIVHATLGHKIDHVQMLVDVLQATRNLPRNDFTNAVAILKKMRLGLECAVCLSVVGQLFDDDVVNELAAHFIGGIRSKIGRKLITPDVVVQAQGNEMHKGSWRRRKTFRMLQYLP